jgi:hypothetical protein
MRRPQFHPEADIVQVEKPDKGKKKGGQGSMLSFFAGKPAKPNKNRSKK